MCDECWSEYGRTDEETKTLFYCLARIANHDCLDEDYKMLADSHIFSQLILEAMPMMEHKELMNTLRTVEQKKSLPLRAKQ